MSVQSGNLLNMMLGAATGASDLNDAAERGRISAINDLLAAQPEQIPVPPTFQPGLFGAIGAALQGPQGVQQLHRQVLLSQQQRTAALQFNAQQRAQERRFSRTATLQQMASERAAADRRGELMRDILKERLKFLEKKADRETDEENRVSREWIFRWMRGDIDEGMVDPTSESYSPVTFYYLQRAMTEKGGVSPSHEEILDITRNIRKREEAVPKGPGVTPEVQADRILRGVEGSDLYMSVFLRQRIEKTPETMEGIIDPETKKMTGVTRTERHEAIVTIPEEEWETRWNQFEATILAKATMPETEEILSRRLQIMKSRLRRVLFSNSQAQADTLAPDNVPTAGGSALDSMNAAIKAANPEFFGLEFNQDLVPGQSQ